MALKVNIGRREFSHVRFYEPETESDDFDPKAYNEGNLDGDPYVRGIYRGNYYDSSTYTIGTNPTFVFTDGSREYTYQFNIDYISGLSFSGSGYNPVHENEYTIKWGNSTITNVTGSGSNYNEYRYAYVYSEALYDYEGYYDALPDVLKDMRVYVLKKEGATKYRLEEEDLFVPADRGIKTRQKLLYADVAAIVAGDLFGARSVHATRLAVAGVALAATALALVGGDIIGVLLKAYSVYTPGVVCPLAVAVLAPGRVDRRLWFVAVALGGLCGLAGAIVPRLDVLPGVGMILSLALSLAGLRAGRDPRNGPRGAD